QWGHRRHRCDVTAGWPDCQSRGGRTGKNSGAVSEGWPQTLDSIALAPGRRDRRWPEGLGGDRRESKLQHVWTGPAPTRRVRRKHMRCYNQRLVPVLMTLSLLFLVVMPVWAADPELDRLLRSPVGKDWVTNGGN